jgi:S-adenosylmethionine:tRNA ribosyltransferase-isomerase
MTTRSMDRRSDYAYDLPPDRIAQTPAERRDASRLLVVDRDAHRDRAFADIVDEIPPGSLLVVNDTRVIKARLHTVKDSGGHVELLFIEPVAPPGTAAPASPGAAEPASAERWRCMAKARRPLREGQLLRAGDSTLRIASGRADDTTILVDVPGDTLALLERSGELPLPHYIEREGGPRPEDAERYQTVFAREPGAVAAPTAGLHFTPALVESLRARGCSLAPVTLHVGMGTFTPVRVDELSGHVMHAERYSIPAATAEAVAAAGAAGRPGVAIGTTAVRALESAATGDHEVAAGPASTRLFIRPGYRFRVVDRLLTNFHLPESTLLMLVSAFAGHPRVMAAYRHAVASGYRFFSYGDAMLCCRESSDV